MNPNETASTREAQNAHPTQAAPRALLLDDNLMSALRLRRQLQLLGYEVEERRNVTPIGGDEAPQLVVINLGSRGINGAALAKSCRETFPNVRVVGFCGHLETEIRRQAREAGIHKILTNEQAFSALESALSR